MSAMSASPRTPPITPPTIAPTLVPPPEVVVAVELAAPTPEDPLVELLVEVLAIEVATTLIDSGEALADACATAGWN